MATERPHHYGHLLQVIKESLQPLTLCTSFQDLISVYSRRSGADNPRGCQQKPLVTSAICYKFQKNLFEVWLYTFFFHDFIHVYSPGAGADNPLWTKLLCLKTKTFWSLILYICFMILYMYIAPGQGQSAPRGLSFDVNRNVLSLHSFVASFKSLIVCNFFMI